MTPEEAARYARQIMLAEVGEAGQERLRRASAAVAGRGLVHEVAERYLRRAGFGGVTEGPLDLEDLAPPSLAVGAEARAVLAGSRAAVRVLWAALESGP